MRQIEAFNFLLNTLPKTGDESAWGYVVAIILVLVSMGILTHIFVKKQKDEHNDNKPKYTS